MRTTNRIPSVICARLPRLRPPSIAPTGCVQDGVIHHTLMIDGTYIARAWCLITANEQTGQVIVWQWYGHENMVAYIAPTADMNTSP